MAKNDECTCDCEKCCKYVPAKMVSSRLIVHTSKTEKNLFQEFADGTKPIEVVAAPKYHGLRCEALKIAKSLVKRCLSRSRVLHVVGADAYLSDMIKAYVAEQQVFHPIDITNEGKFCYDVRIQLLDLGTTDSLSFECDHPNHANVLGRPVG